MSAYMPKSKSQTHITPQRVYEIIKDTWGYSQGQMYDPCPSSYNKESYATPNGLFGDWKEINYVNPPYEVKTLTKFVIKAIEEAKKGRVSIMLLPTKTDQDWFHDLIIKNYYQIKYIRKRLKFVNNNQSSMNSHFLVKIINLNEPDN